MVDLRKPEKENNSELVEMPVKVLYPEYEEYIAYEVAPKKPEPPENAVLSEKPAMSAVLPKLNAAPHVYRARTSLTEAERTAIIKYFTVLKKVSLNFEAAIIVIGLLIIIFIPMLGFANEMSVYSPRMQILFYPIGIILLFFIYRNKAVKGINIANICVKKISMINYDGTARLTDGTLGKFLDVNYTQHFKDGDSVEAIMLNLNGVQKRLNNVVDTFIVKL